MHLAPFGRAFAGLFAAEPLRGLENLLLHRDVVIPMLSLVTFMVRDTKISNQPPKFVNNAE